MSDRNLYRDLFLARKAADAVAKQGHSQDGDYSFARAEDVLEEAGRQLEKRDILIIPSVEEVHWLVGKSGMIARVDLTFEVRSTKTGESFTRKWTGTGFDSPGDKAPYKAITGGEKYFLAKLLGIPFGTDPEADAAPAEQAPALSPEAQRISDEQDAAAEAPDQPPRLKPVPKSELPEPDWTGIAAEEPARG